MAIWCLPKHLTSQFLEKLRSGEINPEKLMNMTSDERREYFNSHFGEEHGKNINAGFESKLLLKNQQTGIINWAKNLAGLKPEAQKDLISKVNKLDTVLNPENEKQFYKDYASYKLGTAVTMNEAKTVSDLAKTATDKKAEMEKGGDRMEYGRSRVALQNYLNELKSDKSTPWETIKDIKEHPGKALSTAAGVAKSLKVTFTNAIVRHGLWVAVDSPEIWFKNSLKSFKDMWDTAGGKPVMDEVNADKYSRPNYMNGNYGKDKLAVGVTEEGIPNSDIIEKIPYLGRLQKISSNAFEAFQMRNRMDLYDKVHEILEDRYGQGEGTGKGAGEFANGLTIRGNLGKFEGSGADLVNKFLFSPRFLKSQFDNLTMRLGNNRIDPMLKRRSAVNLVKYLSATAAIITAVNKLKPGTVNYNPLKPDFGHIKVGDTRFDMTAGMSSMVVLAAKLADQIARHTGAYKAAQKTGIIKNIPAQEYKTSTEAGVDIVKNFTENKLSPAASLVKDILKGKDFEGKPITLGGEMGNLVEPIPFTSFEELKDPNSANKVLSIIADELGISARTYPSKSSGRP